MSRPSWRGLVMTIAVLIGVALVPARVEAGSRKRVVVLELEGPKAEKFHSGLIKLIKKQHTVIPLDKWNSTAEDLGATSLTDKDVKKVAKRLKIDIVVFGRIDKRRSEYLIQLQVRNGRSGQIVGNRIDTKSGGPRLDGKSSRDLKDELLDAISDLASAKGSDNDDDDADDDDDEDARPSKRKAMKKDADDEDDEDARPSKRKSSKKSSRKSKKDDDEDADDEDDEDAQPSKRKGFSRKRDDDDAAAAALKTKKDDEAKKSKSKSKSKDDDDDDDDGEDDDEDGKRKKVASSDDDDDEDGEDGEDEEGIEAGFEAAAGPEAVTPANRAVDLVVGLSFNMRRMSFTYQADLTSKPPPYRGVPVAGVLIDATVFPLAIGHKRRDMLKNIGLSVMYDKVLKIESKAMGQALPTSQARYAIGAAFRYPLGAKAVVGATLRYGRQNFTISPAMGVMPDIPNVNYTIVDPGVMLRVQAAPKVVLNANLGFMLIMGTGQIAKPEQYGRATIAGFEGELGGDYMLTTNIFARAAFKFETIGFKFKGTGTLSTGRDADPEQDVFGARDTYLGGAVSVGLLY